MKSIKVCEYSRSRSFHDDLMLLDQASGEHSQDQWSSGYSALQCYGHETENLQSLALQLGCKARGLNGELRLFDTENDKNRANVSHHHHHHHKKLSIGILSTVADLIGTLKSLVAWMDKCVFVATPVLLVVITEICS